MELRPFGSLLLCCANVEQNHNVSESKTEAIMATTSKVSPPAPQAGPATEEAPAEEIRRLNGEYRFGALRLYEIEGILRQKYDMDAPKVPKPVKAKAGLVTEAVIEKVRAYLADKPNGINNTAFTRELGLCGISGLQEVNSARAELVNEGVIVVEELGASTGRGSAKLIKLAANNG